MQEGLIVVVVVVVDVELLKTGIEKERKNIMEKTKKVHYSIAFPIFQKIP